MRQEHQLVFGSFRLDPIKKKLWRGTEEVDLQPRPLAVLHYLVARPGQVVTKEELLKQVWQGTYVTKTALKVSIRAIRKALGDEVRDPQYLETVGWEGYRFLTQVDRREHSVVSKKTEKQKVRAEHPSLAPTLVGREQELSQLHYLLSKALNDQRQVVFVTGEPGIGKTTLVDVFLSNVENWEVGDKEQKHQTSKSKS